MGRNQEARPGYIITWVQLHDMAKISLQLDAGIRFLEQLENDNVDINDIARRIL